jgi:spoIIIJ-associated protein
VQNKVRQQVQQQVRQQVQQKVQQIMSEATQKQIERGSAWLGQLLMLSNFPAEVKADLSAPLAHSPAAADTQDEVVWLNIEADGLSEQQVEMLVGDRGCVLDAIQYMASLELNLHMDSEAQLPFVVDLNGYRDRRLEELRALVDEAATQLEAGSPEFEIQSLSSAERRQVHTVFKDNFPDFETFSRGKEPDRCLVVRPRSAPAD